MKLKGAAKKVKGNIEETLTHCNFPSEYWTRIRTNNVIERLDRQIRRTRALGSFPDGNSALFRSVLGCAIWPVPKRCNKKYMNMKHLEMAIEDTSIAG